MATKIAVPSCPLAADALLGFVGATADKSGTAVNGNVLLTTLGLDGERLGNLSVTFSLLEGGDPKNKGMKWDQTVARLSLLNLM